MGVTVVSWNIAKKREPWRELVRMDADVALLQEAVPPPDDVVRHRDATLPPAEGAGTLDIGPRDAWDSHSWNSDWWRVRGWKALFDRWPMVVKLSDRVEVEWFKQISPTRWIDGDEIAASGIGTITAARVTPKDGSIEPFIVVSMYARWMDPHPSVKTPWNMGYSDGSVHRIISDLSAFIGHENPETHRILAAGDLNIAHGYGDGGNPAYWEARYRSVFDRMTAIGMESSWVRRRRTAVRRRRGRRANRRTLATSSRSTSPGRTRRLETTFNWTTRSPLAGSMRV